MPDLVILIDIPALDRLVTYLEGQEQVKIDAATSTVKAITSRLTASSSLLKTTIGENNAS